MHARPLRSRPAVPSRRSLPATAPATPSVAFLATPPAAVPARRPLPATPLPGRVQPAGAAVPTDEALLAGLLAAESDALWRAFFARFEGLVVATIRRAARARGVWLGDDEIEDVQAGFAALLLANGRRALRAFDPARGTALRSWIAMLADRHAITYLRARRVRLRHVPGALEAQGLWNLVPSRGPSPEEEASRRQLLGRLRGALGALGRRQRELFDLCFGQGLEPVEVAGRMGTTLQTVHARRHKMELRLVQAIHGAGPLPAAA